jgi:hypothetical protein
MANSEVTKKPLAATSTKTARILMSVSLCRKLRGGVVVVNWKYRLQA